MAIDVNYKRQLIDYIKNNLKKGYTKESLKWALINQGHSKLEIEQSFRRVEIELAKEAPILKTKPKITYESFQQEEINNKPDYPKPKKAFWKRIFE